jgi:cytochrome P450
MLNPDCAKGQYTPPEAGLTDDAVLMFVAGTDTTANALVNVTWGVLNNSQILKTLQTELRLAIPDKNEITDWAILESLPYLRAVIKESLRFSYGVSGRIPRTVPPSGATFCGQSIPPGTSVAHSAYCYHTDDNMFADAKIFRPERWLESAEKYQELENRMLSFSRGSRSCLGIK